MIIEILNNNGMVLLIIAFIISTGIILASYKWLEDKIN